MAIRIRWLVLPTIGFGCCLGAVTWLAMPVLSEAAQRAGRAEEIRRLIRRYVSEGSRTDFMRSVLGPTLRIRHREQRLRTGQQRPRRPRRRRPPRRGPRDPALARRIRSPTSRQRAHRPRRARRVGLGAAQHPSAKLVSEVQTFAEAAIRTGHADPEDVDHYLRQGVHAFLAKDYAGACAIFRALLLPVGGGEV